MVLLLISLISLFVVSFASSEGSVTSASSREACRGLLDAAGERDDAELGLLCRSRMDHKECSAVLDSLGARPWSSAARESTCKHHGDLLAQRVLLQHDAGKHGYIVPLDSTTNNKTTKAPGTEYIAPEAVSGEVSAAVAPSSTQASATTRQHVTTTDQSTSARFSTTTESVFNSKLRAEGDEVTTVTPSSAHKEVTTPQHSISFEPSTSLDPGSSTEEPTTSKSSTTTKERMASVTTAEVNPKLVPGQSSQSSAASVQTVHDVTGHSEHILMSSISDGSEPIMPTALDGTAEPSSYEDSSPGTRSSGLEADSTARAGSDADSATDKSYNSDLSSAPSSESESPDLSSQDSLVSVQGKFQLPGGLDRQQGAITARAWLTSAVAAISLVAGFSTLVLRSRWVEGLSTIAHSQYSRVHQSAPGSESTEHLTATRHADIESAVE